MEFDCDQFEQAVAKRKVAFLVVTNDIPLRMKTVLSLQANSDNYTAISDPTCHFVIVVLNQDGSDYLDYALHVAHPTKKTEMEHEPNILNNFLQPDPSQQRPDFDGHNGYDLRTIRHMKKWKHPTLFHFPNVPIAVYRQAVGTDVHVDKFWSDVKKHARILRPKRMVQGKGIPSIHCENIRQPIVKTHANNLVAFEQALNDKDGAIERLTLENERLQKALAYAYLEIDQWREMATSRQTNCERVATNTLQIQTFGEEFQSMTDTLLQGVSNLLSQPAKLVLDNNTSGVQSEVSSACEEQDLRSATKSIDEKDVESKSITKHVVEKSACDEPDAKRVCKHNISKIVPTPPAQVSPYRRYPCSILNCQQKARLANGACPTHQQELRKLKMRSQRVLARAPSTELVTESSAESQSDTE